MTLFDEMRQMLVDQSDYSGRHPDVCLLRQWQNSFGFFEVDRGLVKKAISKLEAQVMICQSGLDDMQPTDTLLLILLCDMAGINTKAKAKELQ